MNSPYRRHYICLVLNSLFVAAISSQLNGQGVIDAPDFRPPEVQIPYTDWVRSVPQSSQDRFTSNVATDAENVVYRAAIMAGSSTGTPVDSPSDRIDANLVAGPFAGVGSLEVVSSGAGTFICTGTAVSPNFVLTAAHCFDLDDDGTIDSGLSTTFNLNAGVSPSSQHAASTVSIHPDWNGFTAGEGHDDLALVELATPLPAGIPIYPISTTPIAADDELILVGYGASGFGDDVAGYTVNPDFNIKRVGRNIADAFVADADTGQQEIFIYDFDGPDATTNISGSGTLGNAIETTIGGGDSGGPAFAEVDGDLILVGVNSFTLDILPITKPVPEFGSLGGGIDLASYATFVAFVPEPTGLALAAGALAACSLLRTRRFRSNI